MNERKKRRREEENANRETKQKKGSEFKWQIDWKFFLSLPISTVFMFKRLCVHYFIMNERDGSFLL